jgi:RNA polymerase primary sigma factor
MEDFTMETNETFADKALACLLETLTGNEAAALRMRVGFGGDKPLSMEEVGVALELPLESVRRILAKTLKKLRHPTRAMLLSKTAGVSLDDLDWYKNLCEEVWGT